MTLILICKSHRQNNNTFKMAYKTVAGKMFSVCSVLFECVCVCVRERERERERENKGQDIVFEGVCFCVFIIH